MVHLGESRNRDRAIYAESGLAKHTIDILAMLQCKTRANATGRRPSSCGPVVPVALSYVKKTG
jgi:hypothetical protein